MNIGLLWYDASKRALADRIAPAARRYRERFGEEANVCYVNPAELPDGECQINDIHVLPLARILCHHLWLEQESGPGDGARSEE